jgi:hypothetical protein
MRWLSLLQVLLRALRDFNLGKLTSDDTSIFLGLLNDLFPKTLELVPRAVEKEFEAKVGCCWLCSHTDSATPSACMLPCTLTCMGMSACDLIAGANNPRPHQVLSASSMLFCRSRRPPLSLGTSLMRRSA